MRASPGRFRPRILFLSEAVTWSQVIRLVVLARSLDREAYEVHFAAARFDDLLFAGTDFRRWSIRSIEPEAVERAVARGSRIYDRGTLAGYVADELRLYDEVRPHLVVSDLRWSTAISAPAFGVPCATLINAYWSRHARRSAFPMPDHPLVRFFGVARAEKYFPRALPAVFKHFAAPVNDLRRAHKLAPLGDLFDVITWGDRTLFPDDPALVPLDEVAGHQRFLGPITWSPDAPLPPGWDRLGRQRPLIYATLGSSGATGAVPSVLGALGDLDVDVVFSTANRLGPGTVPANVTRVDVAPGAEMARRAAVVVCNGGASTAYQALAEGTPVVGIPENLDACLAMTAIQDAGAGVMLRAGTVTPDEVRAAVQAVMTSSAPHETARRVAASFARHDPAARFREVVDEMVG